METTGLSTPEVAMFEAEVAMPSVFFCSWENKNHDMNILNFFLQFQIDVFFFLWENCDVIGILIYFDDMYGILWIFSEMTCNSWA